MLKGTNEIFTVGHSNHSMSYFIELLKKYQINCIADVRSVPFSKYTSQFNQHELKKDLFHHSIQYVFMGEEFGARRSDRSLYHAKGYVDFAKTQQSPLFLRGIERVAKGMRHRLRIALMCTEKDPLDCHRFSLVARGFHHHGYAVQHILADGSMQSQEQLEKMLLGTYFPQSMEISLFSENPPDRAALIEEAYSKKNAEIGFRQTEERETATL